MRRLIYASMFLLLSGFLLHASVQAADKIRIGFPDLAAPFVPLAVGEKRGFFQEQGVQAEFIRINPAIALQALAGGEIDYYTVLGPGVAAAIRGVPVKLVAAYVPVAPTALIARPEIKSVPELKGKTIGVNAYGGALEAMARLIFKHFGLDPDKEVKFLATGPIDSRFGAMTQGLTVATLGSPPIDFLGKKLGFVVLARAHELFSFPVSGLIASARKIKERPDEIRRVIKAGIKANRYIRENRDGTLPVMMEWLKIDKEMATATYDSSLKSFSDDLGLPEDGLRILISEAQRTAKVDREIPLSEVADLSILREVQKELGIKRK
jgi:ABC-type nitrate/sulfonate/bicarbonate transport system substrate-binding protein